MIARIVVANQAEARFYDAAGVASPLRVVGQLESPDARLHARDPKSDRAGRVFTSAATGSGRCGALPKSLQSDVAAEITKELQDPGDDQVREHIPELVFHTVP